MNCVGASLRAADAVREEEARNEWTSSRLQEGETEEWRKEEEGGGSKPAGVSEDAARASSALIMAPTNLQPNPADPGDRVDPDNPGATERDPSYSDTYILGSQSYCTYPLVRSGVDAVDYAHDYPRLEKGQGRVLTKFDTKVTASPMPRVTTLPAYPLVLRAAGQ
ncbi:hypothetical protein B7463_g10586, partial [Scytalidium lignicola]